MTLAAIDLCAGAGGLSLGLVRAGWDVLGVELDADAAATHRANVGPCVEADMTTWSPSGPADLVCGGVPCQSFSPAGRGGGFSDPRGVLYLHLLRIAREASARCVMIENSRGMTARRDEAGCRAHERIAADIRGAGWPHVTMRVLDAADYGVPQRRKRLFIVGFRDAEDAARFRWPAPTHGAPRNVLGLPAWRTVREALGLEGAYESGLVAHAKPGQPSWMRRLDVDAAAPPVTASTAPELLSRLLDAPSGTVTTRNHDEARSRHSPVNDLRFALADAGLIDRPGTTISCGNQLSAAGHHVRQQNGAVRLTPAQCAALQSFPAEWTWCGASLRSVHKQIGNSVPPPLAEAVGAALRGALYATLPSSPPRPCHPMAGSSGSSRSAARSSIAVR